MIVDDDNTQKIRVLTLCAISGQNREKRYLKIMIMERLQTVDLSMKESYVD